MSETEQLRHLEAKIADALFCASRIRRAEEASPEVYDQLRELIEILLDGISIRDRA